MSFLGFGAACDLDIELNREDGGEKKCSVKNDNGDFDVVPLYTGSQGIIGQLHVKLKPGKKLEHAGISINLVGQIEVLYDRSNPFQFKTVERELESAGTLTETKSYPFDFSNVSLSEETYRGNNVRLRYFLRVRIARQYSPNIHKELDLAVQNLEPEPEVNNSIKMEVGIEDCLHIEFEYARCKYHLTDVVIGKIYFLLVRIKIKFMELIIVKRESTGSGPNTYNESENLSKFELMDGAPVRGESIPIRLFLSPYGLTPTYKNIHNRFSVKYFLNLVLVDVEDRRYFKQQEIIMWRKEIGDTSPEKFDILQDENTNQ